MIDQLWRLGKDKNANACLNCGTSWRASDLYKTLQTIKGQTGVTLNLAQEEDRLYMNSFMSEVGSYLESVSTIEEKNRKRIEEKQNKSGKKSC